MIYESTVPVFIRGLQNMNKILDKAAAFADHRKVDMSVLLQARLFPDQFPLIRQIQIASDTAKFAVARLCGKEAPQFPDTEQTLAEIKSRVDKTINYLKTIKQSDFTGADSRKITTPRWDGKHLSATEYVHVYALPNFYFHITTGYSILRHNGVEIGKADYLGEMPFK